VPGQRHRGPAIGRLAHHADVLAGLQQHPEPRPDQGLVVGEQHPYHPASPVRGSVALTSKPPSPRGPAVTSPPTAAARSAIPASPWPCWPGGTPPLEPPAGLEAPATTCRGPWPGRLAGAEPSDAPLAGGCDPLPPSSMTVIPSAAGSSHRRTVARAARPARRRTLVRD